MSTVTVGAGRHAVRVARAEKELFPARAGAPAVTKADLAAYYRDIAAYALPHLRDRPLMLEIHPDGIDGPRFMLKNTPSHYPDWIKRTELAKEGGTVTHVLANTADTLVYLAGQGCTTLHRWQSRADRPRQPDRMVFDLDPTDAPGGGRAGAGDPFAAVRRAARALGELLDELELPWAPMTSGSRGLHLVVPLDRQADVDEVRDFAREVADTLAARHPDELTTQPRKHDRGRRLYLDVLRNGYAQTAVAPWSVRALPGAPVAAPITREALEDPALDARRWTIRNALQHAAEGPWDGLLPARGRSLGPAARRLRALAD
ncbi:non-homologous end-joining DNA ligase [Streptomyces sp. NBC_01190]|uniref:non-homologous end-joining DNA ligase n=1 Tax=Streptomyces sp. NBC_01190 TaxID=2903767 RepID=UPI00386ABD9A|nr:non-homologous end-joining DNA ligase [Streptomyces sp. NBC_01190]